MCTLYEKAKRIADKFDIAICQVDDSIEFGGAVTMTPETIEVERVSLRGRKTEMVEGWVVDVAVPYHGRPSEPDDVDIKEIGQYESADRAIESCINTVRAEEVHQAFEDICWEEMATEYNNKEEACPAIS